MLRRTTLMPQSGLRISLSLLFLLSLTILPAHADRIHFLSHNGAGWFDQDLTALTNANLPNPATGITALSTTGNNRLHVFYATTDQHVHQLSFNNTNWSDQDLTAVTGGPLSLGFGGISGFAIGQRLHVFYLGNDLHVHQLFFNNATWVDQDITALANGTVTDFNSLVAFPTVPDNHLHVFYLANSSNDIHELNFNGSTWSDQNLRTIAHQEPAARGWMAGFATGNQQHLFFAAFSPKDKLHLAHLFFSNSKWVNQNVSAKVHGLPLSPAAGITAFAVTAGQLEAYGVTNDFDVHQFTLKNNTWTDEDLTGLAGQQDFSIGGMVAFRTTPNNQFHLFYPPNDIDQLFFNGSIWSDIDLTTLTGGGIPNGKGGMAGFAIKNLQYAFYVAQ
jgi:hypothetical protein